MVKKIIALSVALVLMLTSILYGGNIDLSKKDSTVSFGAGDGTSKVVETTADLEKLLSNIPSVKDYLGDKTILEQKPDFKPFTMVEEGKSTDKTDRKSTLQGDMVWIQTVAVREHSLEICFTATAVYYHAIGEMTSEENVWERGEEDYYLDSDPDNYISGESTKTTYDIEIYYSSELILVKYNDYAITAYEANSYDNWTESEGEDNAEMAAALEMVEASFGKWMKVETEDGELGDQEPDSMDAMVDALVKEFCREFSTTVIDSITTSTEANTVYLAGLAGFIVENSETHFEYQNGKYNLKYGDKEDGGSYQKDYLQAIGISVSNDSVSGSTSYNLGSDVITVSQRIHVGYSSGSSTRSQDVQSETTFQNIDNTVVSLKDAKISTVEEVLGAEFKKYIEEQMGGMQ